MTTVLHIEHAVGSFDAWKRAFDSDPIGRKRSGVRRYRVLRATEDPNYVMIDLEFEGSKRGKYYVILSIMLPVSFLYSGIIVSLYSLTNNFLSIGNCWYVLGSENNVYSSNFAKRYCTVVMPSGFLIIVLPIDSLEPFKYCTWCSKEKEMRDSIRSSLLSPLDEFHSI